MKKTLAALALAAGTAMISAPASAYTVSGIDFGNDFGGLSHIETTTLAQTYINPATTGVGAGSGTGYGYITTVNDISNYCVAGGGCGLYYTVDYTGGTFLSASEIVFTGTTIKMYYLNGPQTILGNQNSPANLATIAAGTLYATLEGHGWLTVALGASNVSYSTGFLTGESISFQGNGLLDVNTTDLLGNLAFESYLNGNKVTDANGGKADLIYTESVNNFVLNQHDIDDGLANGCQDGTAATGAWCLKGTLNTRGAGVLPEPATMALLGLGLLGMGFSSRRKGKKTV